MRILRLLAFFLASWAAIGLAAPGASAQARRVEPSPACVSACTETCQKDLTSNGCNPAVGLTACRIRQDQCVAVCARKCPRD